MTYPTGSQGGILPGQPQPGGAAQQGGNAQQGAGQPGQPGGAPSAAAPARPQGAAQNPFARMSLPALLAAGTALFSVIAFFCSFPATAASVTQQSMYLLAGGLLAGIYLLPKSPKVLPAATVLSVVGGLSMLLAVVHTSGAPGIMIVLLILGLLQMLLSVAALLFDLDVVKLPAPKPAAAARPEPSQQTSYARTGVFPPAGGYQPGQQAQPGQGQPGQAQPGQAQPGQAQQNRPQGPAPQQSQPGQGQPSQGQPGQSQQGQQTLYAPKQGQFSSQPPPPSTPPGGFAQPPQ